MDAERQGIDSNVRLAIDELGPLSGIDFGLDRASVEWVEGFIERQRARPDFDPTRIDGLVGVLGSFLGACLVAAAGGRWDRVDEQAAWGVHLSGGEVAFPFAKVRKQFLHGLDGGDSILSFYDVAVDHLATGGFRDRP